MSPSQTREVIHVDGALFGSPDPGFALYTVTETELIFTFVNAEGQVIYQYSRADQPGEPEAAQRVDWSSTSYQSGGVQEQAWYVFLGNGVVYHLDKTITDYYVWPVRGGQ